MFFLLRSAVCIGLVVAAVPSGGAVLPEPGALVDAVAPSAASVIGRLCGGATARCLDLATGGWRGAGGGHRAARVRTASQDTLTPGDLRPRWAGPLLLSRD